MRKYINVRIISILIKRIDIQGEMIINPNKYVIPQIPQIKNSDISRSDFLANNYTTLNIMKAVKYLTCHNSLN